MGDLGALNESLLHHLDGSLTDPPKVSVSEMIRLLRPYQGEAQDAFVTAHTHAIDVAAPWIWADPRNCILVPFWIDLLDPNPIAILAFNPPDELDLSYDSSKTDVEFALSRWDLYNRSALTVSNVVPTLVLGAQRLRESPHESQARLAKFFSSFGLENSDLADLDVEDIPARQLPAQTFDGALPDRASILYELLTRYEGLSATELTSSNTVNKELALGFSTIYDEKYYESHCGHIPYNRDEPHWMKFFAEIARSIRDQLAPINVLDVGCATGMLVEALRSEGLDARGIDVSEWAIDQVPASIRPYCRVGSVTEDLGGFFDLITCVEVLEHLPRSIAPAAVSNLCAHADRILFSSTPTDFDEPTHLNVETPSYWAQLFAISGFTRDFDFDASFLSPQATLFCRHRTDVNGLISGYERALWNLRTELVGDREEFAGVHSQLAHELSARTEQFGIEMAELDARRKAEVGAAQQALGDADRTQLELGRRLEHAEQRFAEAVFQLEAVYGTRLFRYTSKLRSAYATLRGRPKPWALTGLASIPEPELPSYATWLSAYDTVDDEVRKAFEIRVSAMLNPPTISVLMPTYNTPPRYLDEAVSSVIAQIYPHWELCIADDCSTDADMIERLAEIEQMDRRIRVERRGENGHISAALNTALSMSSGQWVTTLDHDDTLAEHALAMFALAVTEMPDLGFVYSDEDKIDEGGTRCDPFFKPDFDPLLLQGQNYVCHLAMYRRDLLLDIGGYREGYEGSQDWDLALRASERLSRDQIAHIPRVLYHWRVHPGSTASSLTAKSYAAEAGHRAVEDHIRRTGRAGRVLPAGASGWARVKWGIPDPPPLVSIVIPTRDGTYLHRCIDSVRQRTTYPNFEIVVVDNGSGSQAVLEYLRNWESSLTIIRDDAPFNYPRINNQAVQRCNGEILCLLNDDTEVLGGEWLDEMVGHVLQEGVGAVGAMLYYPNGQVQHAGVILGIGGVAGHAMRTGDRLSGVGSGRIQLPRSISAVTGACMVVRRQAWEQVDGMDAQNLPIAFNDIDLCLRLIEAGWRIVWTPFAEMTHHESISRGFDTEGDRAIRFASEIRYMKERWGMQLRNDPTYNPNLTLHYENLSLAWPPRVPLLSEGRIA
jgi:glycosyltransferase involved in cell wall biosynthesis/2-polyprenyl-3-methyl-5-hydroxy-6-metoxy-1,4-benzoquinol methylase